jgi:hypothetical protein
MRALSPTLEIVSGQLTAAGAVLVASVPLAGDSFTVRNFIQPSRAFIVDAWTFNQVTGGMRIRSPRLHDLANGINLTAVLAISQSLLPYPQQIRAQDNLIVEQSGSAVVGDIETVHMQLYYENLDASQGKYISKAELAALGVGNILGLRFALVAGVVGQYSGATSLAAAQIPAMKANVNYALLGCKSSLLQGAITVRGTDLGNVRVGMPADLNNAKGTGYFLDLCDKLGGGQAIPVVNGANAATTFVETVNNENAASPFVTLYFAELATPGVNV